MHEAGRPGNAKRGHCASLLLAGRAIRASDTIAAILHDEPRLLETLLRGGLSLLAGAHVRQTFGRVVTVGQACRRMEVDEATLLRELNQTRDRLRRLEIPLVHVLAQGRASRL